jgi:hypothetical protein
MRSNIILLTVSPSFVVKPTYWVGESDNGGVPVANHAIPTRARVKTQPIGFAK